VEPREATFLNKARNSGGTSFEDVTDMPFVKLLKSSICKMGLTFDGG
jgi:hypothetical protein